MQTRMLGMLPPDISSLFFPGIIPGADGILLAAPLGRTRVTFVAQLPPVYP
jgi:hypothetical protein